MKSAKHIPERTCVICRTKKPKEKLFRFLIRGDKVIFDKNQKGSGRGFYICSKECWEEGVKKRRKIKIGSQGSRFIGLPEKGFEEIMGR